MSAGSPSRIVLTLTAVELISESCDKMGKVSFTWKQTMEHLKTATQHLKDFFFKSNLQWTYFDKTPEPPEHESTFGPF